MIIYAATKARMSESGKIKIFSKEHKKNLSIAGSGKNNSNYGNTGESNVLSKKVIINNVVYYGIRQTAKDLDLRLGALRWRLNSKKFSNYSYA